VVSVTNRALTPYSVKVLSVWGLLSVKYLIVNPSGFESYATEWCLTFTVTLSGCSTITIGSTNKSYSPYWE